MLFTCFFDWEDRTIVHCKSRRSRNTIARCLWIKPERLRHTVRPAACCQIKYAFYPSRFGRNKCKWNQFFVFKIENKFWLYHVRSQESLIVILWDSYQSIYSLFKSIIFDLILPVFKGHINERHYWGLVQVFVAKRRVKSLVKQKLVL